MCMHLTCACIFMCMTYICIKEHQPSNQRPVQAPAERVRRAHTWSFTSRAFTSRVIGSNSNMYGNSTVCHCVRLDRHNNNNNTITNSSSTTTHDEAYALAGPFTIDCANVASRVAGAFVRQPSPWRARRIRYTGKYGPDVVVAVLYTTYCVVFVCAKRLPAFIAPLTLQQTVVTASVRSETQARFPPSIKSYFQPVNLKKSDNAPHLAAHGLWLAYSISYVLDCISTASCTRSAASSARLGTRRRRCSTSRRRAWRGSTSSQRAGAREAERLGYQLLVTW